MKSRLLLSVLIAAAAWPVSAEDTRATCIIKMTDSAPDELTASEIRSRCEEYPETEAGVAAAPERPARLQRERETELNPSVLTPHKQNYILPYTYMSDPNQAPYDNNGLDDPVKHQEAKFQVSIKAPLTFDPMLTDDDVIYFGFTLKSFWQVYADSVSAPFRETNYNPEIFYRTSLPWHPGNGTVLWAFGAEHESNGRSQLLSRSWNRVSTSISYLKDDWGVSIKPWYRLPEDAKPATAPGQPPAADGDDNPDITKYLGHYEIRGVYVWDKLEFSNMTRYNWQSGYGAVELGMSFPLYGKMRGFVQYFNGYGESLIDYNASIERIGIGFLLTDLY